MSRPAAIQDSREQAKLSAWLWRVTEYCLRNRGRCFRAWPREKVFRYVAFCHLTGRLWVWHEEGGAIGAVAFAWSDWSEHIEARAEQGLPQFTWTKIHTANGQAVGDALMVCEVIGSRPAVAHLARGILSRYPLIAALKQIFTYRRGKLVRLDGPKLERFLNGRR